jgi:hypothetical protein
MKTKTAKNIYSYSFTLSIAILLIVAFMLIQCGGSFSRQADEEIAGRGTRPKPEYDPLSLEADKTIIPEKYPIEYSAAEDTAWAIDSMRLLPQHFDRPEDDNSVNLYSRYRIQLFSSNTYGPAAREMNIAREVFDREVFLDYEIPYYKVRVGDFLSRLEAEDYLPAAEQSGYENAWVVRVAHDVQTMDDIYSEDEIPEMDIPDRPEDSTYTEPEPTDDPGNYPEN